ncbi:hypothetical protein [Microbispora rosea]|uniref:hypothetical protein n=1 Tax=Microbispora rosea TaxID=58117 RepID=UPI0037B4B554
MDDTTREAVRVLRRAVETNKDFGGWLANVLATVAARHQDGTDALTAGRPGSWEAQHVEQLAAGGYALEDDDKPVDDAHAAAGQIATQARALTEALGSEEGWKDCETLLSTLALAADDLAASLTSVTGVAAEQARHLTSTAWQSTTDRTRAAADRFSGAAAELRAGSLTAREGELEFRRAWAPMTGWREDDEPQG